MGSSTESDAPYKKSDWVFDPKKVYPLVPELPDYDAFALYRDEGGPNYHDTLTGLKAYLVEHQQNFLGYQCNQFIQFLKDLGFTLDMHVNNIGDAFEEGNFRMSSKVMERAMLDYYASLWNAVWAHPNSNSELTAKAYEGNIYGMWNARDYLTGKELVIDGEDLVYRDLYLDQVPTISGREFLTPQFTPVAFYSEDTHYSLVKAMKMLAISTFSDIGSSQYPGECPITVEKVEKGKWPAKVPSTEAGDIDIDALASLVDFFASKKHPILVNFNYDTTFKGAYDDVKTCGETLVEILKKHDMYEVKWKDQVTGKSKTRKGFWFHVDSALGASYMPFIKMAYEQNIISETGPEFDFQLPFVMSIVTSGHKWPDAPMPCGVYMSKNKYRIDPPSHPEYAGVDTTFAGSRNGLSVMALWCHLAQTKRKDQISKILNAQSLAEYAFTKLKDLQAQLDMNLYVARTKLSLTIRFRRPINTIIQKYSLSNETLNDIDYSYIFIMDHVTKELVDRLINDLNSKDSFPSTKKPLKAELISAQRGLGLMMNACPNAQV